ncbi:MAG: hypothetical protein JWO83_3020 [Caulobacteraceae bacterium]|nr:hypothetical protein [Caulobacteraceae bacterium]
MLSQRPERVGLACLVAGLLTVAAPAAKAVPSFAVQTGQPCQACHVGGLGPQLTPFGREFKLHGYTARTVKYNLPLAIFAQASYVSTAKAQSSPPAPGYGTNDNFALDQISLFVAGGVGQHFGAFIQTTYDGIAKAFTWDNLDVRAVTNVDLGRTKAVVGLSLNNNPTVQDAFNTLPAWGFPYTSSNLAPSPAASPMIGNLAQTTIGLTGYAWIDSKLYVEFGGYRSPSAGFLIHAGSDPTSPGNIAGIAPYGRIAYQWNMGDRNVALGAFFLDARIFPGRDQTTGFTDHYSDLGLDASYQYFPANHDVITVNARYTHEDQRLHASTALGLASKPNQTLDDVRVDASYYWRNKVGFSAQVFDTWGSPDDLLYQGNRRRRPDSSGVVLQLDGTPFGDGKSPLGQRFNVRVGIQYTAYFTFDGAHSNFDTLGRSASDNNTFRVFTWIYY